MAGKPRSAIIKDIEGHIGKHGGSFAEWFVGVTDDPRRTLFGHHKLRSNGDAWITRRALDDLQAAEVEDFFRSVRKTRNGNPGKSLNHVYVYAYRMKSHTRP